MSRDELKRRIDEATRKKIPAPKARPRTTEEHKQSLVQGHLEHQRDLTRDRWLKRGLVLKDDDTLECNTCGKRSSKYTSGKFRHLETCKHYSD